MKLTKQLKEEVLKTYQASWNALVRGDIKTFASLLDDQVVIYGSAAGEIFTTKKAAVKFYTATADQITGKVDLRKRKIGLKAVNNTVVVHELCDFFFLTEQGWVFYGPARITDILEKKGKAWKIIHHHTSFPDGRTNEGEQFATEKIKAENLLLRDAVQRRTVELEHKNRELEIETALEKVRSVAMGMKQADDMLLICKTIAQQLAKLGIKEIRNVQTAIFYESKGVYMNYEYYAKHNKTFITETSYTNHRIHKAFAAKMLKGKGQSYVTHIKGQKVKDWIAYQKTTNVFIDTFLHKASSLNYYWHSLGPVALGISTYSPLKKDEHELFERFLKVFELSYRRYLDIEKATAQAREAQIEAALERVRAASMSMRNSTELSQIIYKLYGELTKLDAKLDRCFIMIVNQENKGITWWMAGHEGLLAENGFFVQMNQHPSHLMYLDYCKKRKKKWTYLFEGKEKRDWDRFGFSKTELVKLPQPIKAFMAAAKKVHLSGSSDRFGSLVTGSFEPLPEEQQEIISRFTLAFNQAYIRFLDLQKAEAQAREAQIEAALERVRSRSMAMHKSEELKEVIKVVLEQFIHLNINAEHAGFYIDYKDHDDMHIWLADPNIEPFYATLPYFDTPTWNSFLEAKAKGTVLHTDLLDFKTKNKFYKSLFKIFTVPEEAKQFYLQCKGLAVSTVMLDTVGLYIENFSAIPYTDEENEILIRFGKVFQQTYTRFLDLQKAEAQAREAQIQLALERVRARTMAMHKSDELPETSHLLFEQMKALGEPVEQLTIGIVNEEKKVIEISATLHGGTLKKIYNHSIDEPYMMAKVYKAWKQQQKTLVAELKGDELNAYNKYRNELTNSNIFPTKAGKEDRRIVYAALFSKGMLALGANETRPQESLQLLEKFASVFDLTYTRFLDLQKAEAQAREAQIEAALERVRSKTMAMHNSMDVGESVAVLFNELINLGLLGAADRCGIGIMQANEMMELWTAEKTTEKTALTIGHLNMQLHPLLKNVYQNWLDKKETYRYVLKGEDKYQYHQAMLHQKNYRIKKDYYSAHEKIIHNDFFFKEGCLYVFSVNELTAEASIIFSRFANVFAQTYRRYLDLQKAEAQAREAQIEAALEKVRSRTLAMQKSDELAGTAAVLFQQLISLGIEPNRLYIILIKDNTSDMEAWVTDEDGSKVSMGFTGNYLKNTSLLKMYEGWKAKRKTLVIDMQGEELQQYFHYLHHELNVPFKGGLEQKRRVQHLAYFSHGMIGMASPDAQPIETLELLERFAAVFNLTFTRFNDLKLAEAHALQAEQDLIAIKEAKQKAEKALTELQATQKQLIQSEKMASLGELTAGIAHEIQNPLNFVNNFSEVSGELLKELVDEVEKGNTDEVKALADDVVQNLEKINHHGKRAADIVKGMLQHSRSGSGAKEPTDINALADEYLRLAFHGLRAKDKSFNATMKTDFDATIGTINIIPQDIGRVILNLITNAFYVVNEKSKQGIAGYEPTVEVSTKKEGNKVVVRVKDNGNGIPQIILDKIFQPFFTTKPTGQGTGLGLSLSYDIVKAHGGELKVETKEGEGTVFTFQLTDTFN
ncbi:MAG: SnoaL-like domain-containing protein [Lacibacter sp.]|jgi:signal transduction histidine kinase/ketosteroid isomerase-like protein